ncbi:MAG: restriction endonuclease subunit S [Pseudomonas sp.]
MGRYQAYGEYKDSGIEWLGEIPTHWMLTRIKFITRCLDGARIPLNAQERGDKQGNIPYWGANKVVDHVNDFLFNEDLILLGEDGAPFFDKTKDVAFNVSGKIWPNNHVHVLRPDKCKIDIRFLKHAINCADFHLYISGSTRDKLNQSDMNEIYVRHCKFSEQEKIANFLDHETAKIVTLIEKQQKLIQLLKEKRQAVISHAVTKGLNPNAQMCDSGVEWLGEVPVHWVVAQLKFNTLEMQTGPFGSQLHSEDYVDNGIPLVNPAHMSAGKIVPDSKVSVDQATWSRLSRHQLFEGDLIFARRGELGRCAVVTKIEEGWLCGTGSLKAKLNERLIPEYSYLLITSEGVVSELSLESKGSTMDNLNTETLGRVRLPVPPVDEQKEILAYVKSVSGKYGLLIDRASFAIQLIQERRTALISAAVTGKIDVRDWVAPPANQTDKEVAA